MKLIEANIPTEGVFWSVSTCPEAVEPGVMQYKMWCPSESKWYTTEQDAWDAVREAAYSSEAAEYWVIIHWQDGEPSGVPVIVYTGWTVKSFAANI